MFTRRIILLFIIVTLAALVLGTRLGYMQLGHADDWRDEARLFVNRHRILETSRGTILDRLGRPVAQDVACTDLAIDYRAIVLEDRWLTRRAIERMKKAGMDTPTRIRMLAATKAQIADEIEAIPKAIAAQCNMGVEDVLERFDAIKARISALRQDRLVQHYDRKTDQQKLAASADSDAGEELRDERIAHTVVPNIPEAVGNYFNKNLDRYPGLAVVQSTRREYPYGDVAAHVIGALRPVSKREVDPDAPGHLPLFNRPDLLTDKPGDLHGYLPADDIGGFGIERYAEFALRGIRGVELVRVNTGDTVAEERQDPVAGKDQHLTIDMELQADLHRRILDPASGLLKGRDGKDHNVALVVLDAATGDVLVMLSTPSFDLRTLDARLPELMRDKVNSPLTNRAIAAAYPPGSTLKAFVAMTALANGVVTPSESIHCSGALYPGSPHHFRCDGIHNDVQLVLGLEESCNVFFYTMGYRLGLDRLLPSLFDYGFGRETGLGLVEEIPGTLYDPFPRAIATDLRRQRDFLATASARPDRGQRAADAQLKKSESTMMGIGQGRIAVTPLQLASAYATLLRGGRSLAPRLLASEMRTLQNAVNIDPRQLQFVRQGLELVVSGDKGTAHSSFRGLRTRVAGKTGSATDYQPVWGPDGQPVPDPERPRYDRAGQPLRDAHGQPLFHQLKAEGTDAWFVGYVPADRPRYVICALKEFGGLGGIMAVPLVKEAVLALQRHKSETGQTYLPPLDTE